MRDALPLGHACATHVNTLLGSDKRGLASPCTCEVMNTRRTECENVPHPFKTANKRHLHETCFESLESRGSALSSGNGSAGGGARYRVSDERTHLPCNMEW